MSGKNKNEIVINMTPQEFFKKNNKWILLAISVLFVVKSVQSCNRSMTIRTMETEIVNLNDSLSTMFGTEKETLLIQLRDCERENITLQHKVDLANTERDAANKRADAVQSTYEKTRANTTVTIENKSEKDTVSIKK